MKRHALALAAGAAALALAVPAQAQMTMPPGMKMPGMKMPPPKKKAAPAKKKAAAKKTATKQAGTSKKAAAKKPATKKPANKMPKQPAPEGMSTMPGMEMPPGQTMENMPGMQMPPGQAMPGMTMPPGQTMENMPGMAMPSNTDSEAAGTNLAAGNAPAPPLPTDHAADAVYGKEASEMGRAHLQNFHGGQKLFQLLANIAEYQARSGGDGYGWDIEGWYGGDIDRFWFKSEGEGAWGRSPERSEAQALYSHAIGPYFNLQGGLRYDFTPNPSRVYATLAVEGLAPSFFELGGALFLSNKGELMARGEGWYDQRITQRLILQPRIEFNLAAQNSRAIGVGAGLSDAEIGARLRYDIRREFAPYVGVQYRAAFGKTRRYLREEGEDAAGWEFVAGVRTWF